ncbi:MAG: chromate transporter [Rhodospirillaceae bacterium]|nr:chromate transporter [Rhodospirillaceae bacterium]
MTDPRIMPNEIKKTVGLNFKEALGTWVKIALLSFGGPAGQIALMHRVLVEEKKWIKEARFLHALNYCMLLPGPEAQQLATYIGWLLHRTWGGVLAGVLFILPGAIVILCLSILYAGFSDLSIVKASFFGIKAAVLAVVVQAVLRIGLRALTNVLMIFIAFTAFVAIFFLAVPFPIIVAVAALIGFIGRYLKPSLFHPSKIEDKPELTELDLIDKAGMEGKLVHTQPSLRRACRVLVTCLSLWFLPVLVLVFWLGINNVYTQESLFFSKMAVVTFGGAYAVLAYVAQQAVQTYEWLLPGEMLDGLGMAETTPGPLIMVVQFVGFMGAYRNPGIMDPVLAGVLGAALTTWVTFVPCFLWIFLGGPYIEALRGNKFLSAALSAITAAIVGVILNLALWFGLHVVFSEVGEMSFGPFQFYVPVWNSIQTAALVISMAAMIAMLRFKVGVILTLLSCTLLGIIAFYTGI